MTEASEPEVVLDEPLSTSGKRLTAAAWAEIEAHYEYGTLTTKEISEKYDISGTGIRAHMDREAKVGRKIVKGSKRHMLREAPAAAIVAAATAPSAFMAKRRERAEMSRQALLASDFSNHASMRKIQKKIEEGAEPMAQRDNIDALLQIAKFIAITKKNRWEILEIMPEVNDDELPVLVFKDLTTADIEEHHRHGADYNVDADVADAVEDDDDVIEIGIPRE